MHLNIRRSIEKYLLTQKHRPNLFRLVIWWSWLWIVFIQFNENVFLYFLESVTSSIENALKISRIDFYKLWIINWNKANNNNSDLVLCPLKSIIKQTILTSVGKGMRVQICMNIKWTLNLQCPQLWSELINILLLN